MNVVKQTTYGYLPFCVPEKGRPWFAANVTIGSTAKDARDAFVRVCGQSWEELKREGWKISRIKVELA